MGPFLEQLARLCRARPQSPKWVFVPSHGVGHTLGERLALQGTSWGNLRFVVPLDLALQMAAPFLVERGIEPASDTLGPALVMRLLLELPGSTPAYFRPLAEHPKMAEALWATLRELRLAGLRAADLQAGGDIGAAKQAELTALLTAYETHLAAEALADPASLYEEALRHLDLAPIRPEDVRLEMPGLLWAPVERRFLDALPGQRLPASVLSLPGLTPPRRLALLGSVQAAVAPTPASDAERLAYLLAPAEAPAPRRDGTLGMFRAGGKEAEVEEVFRRIQADRLPLDQVEIACASGEYAGLLWEKAERHEWALTLSAGVPVAFTRPGRALLAFGAWMAGGFPAGGLRRLLLSGDIRVEIEEGPTAGQAARLLAASEATWGRQGYAPALAGVAESYRRRAAEPEVDEEGRGRLLARAAQAGQTAEWVGSLLALAPEPGPDGRLPLGALLGACAGFVKGYAGIGGPLDAAAASALTGGLEELQPLGELSRPLAEGLALIGDRLGELGVGGDRPRPGRLHVSSLAQAGLAGRPHTFVIGLEEGGVFPALVEDPVLLDEERAALSPALATSADRAGEALLLIVSHLAGLGGRVCLSYSCRELRETRETFPSWLLLQALRLQRPGEELTYDHLDRALGEPAAALLSSPERALSEAGWWLSVLRGAGTGGRALLREAYPCLVQGEAAEAARASAVYTPYDGLVPRAGLLLDPRRSERPVSPTSLEGLAACPFRYFLERGLGVEATLEAEADPDAWLDPLTRGQLLHGLYAEILREMRRRGASDPMSYLPGLQLLGERRLEELRVLIPPPSEGVYAREAEELLRDLALFLRLEAAAPGRVTVGVEIPFGSEEPQGEPLGQTEPVEVDLEDGGRIRLRGRIDRIDRLPEGGYEVVDYKTGRPYLPGGLTATFAGGRQLQHGLYALAAGELLRPLDPRARVLCSSYYFPTTRGQGRRVERLQADPTAVKRVLRDLCELLAAGTFLHTADAGACKYCEFQRACGNDPVARAEAKLANPENRVLEAYRRLQTHA